MSIAFSSVRGWGLLLAIGAVSLWAVGAEREPEAKGIDNFHQVNQHIYRGGEPNMDGLRSLKRLGIKTVLDLRMSPKDIQEERKFIEELGMRYVHMPMRDGSAPTKEEINRALGVLDDPHDWPVFVHCDAGKDRTGVVVACYRIAHDHWPPGKALDEAQRDGLHRMAMEEYIQSYRPSGTEHRGKGSEPGSH